MLNILYLVAWKLLRFLPERLAVTIFERIGSLLAKNTAVTSQLRKNLARVLHKPESTVSQGEIARSMQAYMRYWEEVFRMPYWSQKVAEKKYLHNIINEHLLKQAYQRKRGVILVLPHSGNWDAAGLWLVHNYGTFTTVAEHLQPEYLFNKFVDFREKLGFEIIPLSKGANSPMYELEQRLKQGKIVCLLGDRDLSHRGVKVKFFGEFTKMPAGAASLAKKTGAALLPVHCWTENKINKFAVFPSLTVNKSVPEIVQDLANIFENNIRKYPFDWHMLQPLWEKDWRKREVNLTDKVNEA